MLIWMRRYVVWLCAMLAVVGLVLAGVGWLRQSQLDDVMANGVEAVAVIERGKFLTRKALKTYEVNLAWKDRDGKVRRAKDVAVSQEFARKIISDGVLLVPATSVKYLAARPATAPVIVDDAEAQGKAAGQLQLYGMLALVLGVLGAFVFNMRWWRRAGRR